MAEVVSMRGRLEIRCTERMWPREESMMNGCGMQRSFLRVGRGLMGGERGSAGGRPIAVIPHGGQIPRGILAKKPLAAVYSPRGVFQFPVRTFHLLQSEFPRPEKGAVFVACNVWMRQGRKGHFGSTFNLKWLHSNASAIAPSRRAQKRWTDAYGRFQRMFFCG